MSEFDAIADAVILKRAAAIIQAGLEAPDSVDNDAFRNLLAWAVRLYAAKADRGMRNPLPQDCTGLTITETMLTVTDLLHALNVQLFELSMWQAMSGNSIAPHQRLDTSEAFPAEVSNPAAFDRLKGDAA